MAFVEFYGYLVYKFKKLIGRKDFSFKLKKSLDITDVYLGVLDFLCCWCLMYVFIFLVKFR